MDFFTTRISSASSNSPFGQELPLMMRCQPDSSGTRLQGRPSAPSSSTSMKARLQFTGHQLQMVWVLVVDR